MGRPSTSISPSPASKRVQQFTEAAHAENTRKAYRQDIEHFKSNGGRLPATPELVADYLSRFAGVLSVATLRRRLIGIHKAHNDKNLPSPVMDRLVKLTMQGITRTYGVKQRQVKALIKDDLLQLLMVIAKQKPLKAARDKALLLIGFAGAFRRSELVGFQVEDITPHATGIELFLRKSKTDQEGKGQVVHIPYAQSPDRCPVKALQRWLELADIQHGPIFRPVNQGDRLWSEKALTPAAVALVIKAVVGRASGEGAAKDVAGHSLRAGYATAAALAGLPNWQIKNTTRHTSDASLAKYIRAVERRATPSLL